MPAKKRLRDEEAWRFEFKERTPINKRRRAWKRRHLSVSEKLDIIHEALVKMEKHKEIAQRYGIGT